MLETARRRESGESMGPDNLAVLVDQVALFVQDLVVIHDDLAELVEFDFGRERAIFGSLLEVQSELADLEVLHHEVVVEFVGQVDIGHFKYSERPFESLQVVSETQQLLLVLKHPLLPLSLLLIHGVRP